MSQLKTAAAVAILWIFIAAVHAFADPAASLQIDGDVDKPAVWTNAQLTSGTAGSVQIVHYEDADGNHTADCVALLSVINAALPAVNQHIKNHSLQFVVLVRGFDSYTVAFSLAEILPKFGNHAVWLALDRDGKPLSTESSPAALLVPEDHKHGRWVHGVAEITVVDESKIGTPAKPQQ